MQLSPVRQAELHSDLKIQEKDELQWKKIKVEGLDENGEKEAQLRRNFNGEAVFCWKLDHFDKQQCFKNINLNTYFSLWVIWKELPVRLMVKKVNVIYKVS